MGITIEKLRTWIVALGVLLVLAIIGSMAYARYRVHKFGADLPGKLGFEIQQSTNDFTISKSRQGHTLFVLHAAKAVQYKGGGRTVLHDVSIQIYDKNGVRADTISGSQFDYDPATKIVRADGAVAIEIADPSALGKGTKAPGQQTSTKSVAKPPVQVKTSGLVFNQETEVASTDQILTFLQGDSSGSARGATYDADKGTMALAHDVVMHSEVDGDAISIKAESANYDRDAQQLYLVKQVTDYQQRHSSSDQATVSFGPDGNADHVTAEGNLHLTTDTGSSLQATSGRAQLDARGVLKQIKLDGGLLYVSHDAIHSLHMNSTSGSLSFAPAGDRKSSPNHLQLVGAVSVVDQELSLRGDPHGSETRESRAEKMDVDLATDSDGRAQAKSVLADGGAVVVVHTIHEKSPQQVTRLKGNQIFATIANGHEFTSLRATGDTSFEQTTPGGADQTSTADSLMVNFAPGQAAAKKPAVKNGEGFSEQGSRITSAVQQGHAVLVKLGAPTATHPTPTKVTASADHIAYDGETGKILLTGGSPRITQGDSELATAAIEFNHNTQDASASGGVKATYNNPAKAGSGAANPEAMHVIADHATLDHATDETSFFGAPHADARLWQGASSITAPTIVLSKTRQLLSATGPAGGVKGTFVEKGNGKPAKPAAAANAAQGATQGSVVRTASSSLVYSGGERKVTLAGNVLAQDASGTLRAATMELYLNAHSAPADHAKAKTGAGNLGLSGQVDRLIAENHVQFTQGDRSATGEKLVYTAEDGRYVLTGTSAAQPKVTDAQHGSVSGSSLIFNNHDDSVVVSHGQSPTTTDTRTSHDTSGSRALKPGPK
jgi:lipopolysaccharide export system protein LptA